MAATRNVTVSQPSAPDGPFCVALRAAVRGQSLTLDRIRWHLARRGLQVGLSSLSDWQHGRSLPASEKSLRAVRALEEILAVQPGALSGLIDVSRSPVPGLDERNSPVEELMSMVTDTSGDFEVLSRNCKVQVDRNHRAWMMTDHTAIRARRDGLDRYVMRYIGDATCRIDEVRFGRLANCRLGAVKRQAGPTPAMVAELIFDRALDRGETWVFDTELIDETGEPCVDYSHGFRQPVSQFVLELQFDRGAMPVDVHTFTEDGIYTGRRRLSDLRLATSRTAHLAASNVRSGVLGIGWSWPGGMAPAAVA